MWPSQDPQPQCDDPQLGGQTRNTAVLPREWGGGIPALGTCTGNRTWYLALNPAVWLPPCHTQCVASAETGAPQAAPAPTTPGKQSWHWHVPPTPKVNHALEGQPCLLACHSSSCWALKTDSPAVNPSHQCARNSSGTTTKGVDHTGGTPGAPGSGHQQGLLFGVP